MNSTQSSFEKNTRYEIRLAGSGGQGIILAGIILAEAALRDGRHVVHTQNYGPESRGGVSVSDVILSDSDIDYPEALALDILVALTQEAFQRNVANMKGKGFVIVDSAVSHGDLWANVACLPLAQIARDAGEPRAINMAALASVAAFCTCVSATSLTSVMAERLPAARVAVNLAAFNEALKEAQTVKANLQPVETDKEIEI